MIFNHLSQDLNLFVLIKPTGFLAHESLKNNETTGTDDEGM